MAVYDYEESFTEALKEITSNSLKRKLVAMKNIVIKRLQLEKEFKNLHNQIEAKYEIQYKPIYEKRAKIIDGTEVVNVADIQEQLNKLQITDAQTTENTEIGIPEYWSKCICNSDQFAPLINEKDKKILKHLTNVTCDIQENGNFTLNFSFSANDYFEHSVLKREHILNDLDTSISKIISTEIQWKSEDLNPTIEKKQKKIKNKKKGEVKTVTKTEEVPSFFSFFKNYDVNDENKDAEDDEEDEEDEYEIIQEEYEVSLFIKEEMIPYSIEYYLNLNAGEEIPEDEDAEEEDDD